MALAIPRRDVKASSHLRLQSTVSGEGLYAPRGEDSALFTGIGIFVVSHGRGSLIPSQCKAE